jgi:hypothetical protein
MEKHRSALVPLAMLIAGLGFRCAAPDSRTDDMDPTDFSAITEEFFEAYFGFYPTEAAEAGLHEYDALTGPRDAGAIGVYLARLREIEGRLAGLEGPLSSDQQLDRELILRELRSDLFWLDEESKWRKDPRFYASQMDLSLLLLSDHASLEERMVSVVARLNAFPALIQAARDNVENPPLPFVQTALINFSGLPAFLQGDLTHALASVEDRELQDRFDEARDAANESVAAYATHLSEEVLPTANGGYALGPERYRKMNALLAGVDLPIDQLEAIGRAELARLRALGDSLAEQIAPGRGIEGGFEALGADSPPADAIVETAAGDIEGLVSFVDGSGIGTLLPGIVEVKEIPAFRRTNFAYIYIPGPFEAANTAFYFIHPVEEDWSESATADFLRRNNRWSILNTSAHEAYPGHYHHFSHINRAPTKAQQLLTSYVTTEGWAHYTEEMAWREGLAESNPRLGLAVVQDALLRVVRYLSSIGLHTQGMTVEEAERMFRTLAYQDSVNARQQALRGTYDPQYLNYTLGKLMIHDLREDLRKARGAELDLRGFHDEFMSAGAPPVPWIARRLLDDPEWQPFR